MEPKIITSRQNPYIKQLAKLRKRSEQVKQGMFLIEGEHLLDMGIEANIVLTILTTDPKSYKDGIEVIQVSEEVIAKLSSLSSKPNVIGVAKFPQLELKTTDRFLYLDDVQDPGNVGTLIRSALAFGFDGVFASPKSASFFNEKTLLAAQGANFKIPCLTLTIDELLATYKNTHTFIASAINKRAKTLEQIKVNPPLIVILGNEGQGISKQLLNQSDEVLYLPMKEIDSLNVASAGSIILYNFRK